MRAFCGPRHEAAATTLHVAQLATCKLLQAGGATRWLARSPGGAVGRCVCRQCPRPHGSERAASCLAAPRPAVGIGGRQSGPLPAGRSLLRGTPCPKGQQSCKAPARVSGAPLTRGALAARSALQPAVAAAAGTACLGHRDQHIPTHLNAVVAPRLSEQRADARC